MPRKRFSAFDDFPVEDQPEEQKPSPSLFKEKTESHVLHQPEAPTVERIERLAPSQMMPDRFQPRRLLPTVLRQSFYSGQIDCYQAAHQWLQMAKSENGIQAEVNRLLS